LADYTGVAAIIGAYITGVAISLTGFKQEVFEKAETISNSIFVPVFFYFYWNFSLIDSISYNSLIDIYISDIYNKLEISNTKIY